jgi:hypothetical protein
MCDPAALRILCTWPFPAETWRGHDLHIRGQRGPHVYRPHTHDHHRGAGCVGSRRLRRIKLELFERDREQRTSSDQHPGGRNRHVAERGSAEQYRSAGRVHRWIRDGSGERACRAKRAPIVHRRRQANPRRDGTQEPARRLQEDPSRTGRSDPQRRARTRRTKLAPGLRRQRQPDPRPHSPQEPARDLQQGITQEHNPGQKPPECLLGLPERRTRGVRACALPRKGKLALRGSRRCVSRSPVG